MKRALLICCILGLFSCSSRDGLTDKEYGMMFFWEVTSADVTWDECTDEPSFRESFVAPDFPENSFFVYQVSDDGEQLVPKDCTRIDPSTCVDSDLGILFERDGSQFYYDEPQVVGGELAPGCRITSDPLWQVDDQGLELFLDVSVTYGLEGGEACSGVDMNVAAAGTNEFGVDGCVATLGVVTDYYGRRQP